jgi:hypothetical protein
VFGVTFYYKIYDQFESSGPKQAVLDWIACKLTVEPYQNYLLNNFEYTIGEKAPGMCLLLHVCSFAYLDMMLSLSQQEDHPQHYSFLFILWRACRGF